MLTIMEIIEKARMAGIEKFVDVDSVNRGWYVNLLSEEGKKVRMTEAELAEQEAFIQACFEEAKRADEPIPTMTNELVADEEVLEVEYTPEDLTQCNMIDLEDKLGFTTITDENGTYEITNKLLDHIEIMKLAGKPVKTVIVECRDCGRRRMVKIQDAFQVDRCNAHMRSYRNAVRRAKRKAKKGYIA